MAEDELPPIELTDPRAIRALAHPARMAVIDALYSGSELTATECAQIVGLSASAMSYHLRSLEKAGIIVRAPSTGDGRERPYRAAGTSVRVHGSGTPSGLAASRAVAEVMLGTTIEEYQHWLAGRPNEDPAWRDKGGGSNSGQLWLAPDEAEALQQRLNAEIDRYARRGPDERPPGARPVRMSLLLFPLPERAQE